MAISTAQQAQIIAAVKGNFNVRPIELDPFRAGAPYNKHAYLDLKGLHTYSSIEISTDLTLGRLGRVSLERNNKEVIGIDAEYLFKRDSFKGVATMRKGVDGATKTRLVIPFTDEELKTLQGMRRGEYVHKAGETLVLKIQVLGKESGDPDFPMFAATARVTDAQSERFFQQRYTQTSINHTLVGSQKHEFPLVGQNYRIRSMFLDTENNDITRISIKRDNEIIWEQSVEDIRFDQKRYGKKNPPSKGVWLDHVIEGWANEQSFMPFALTSLKLEVEKRTAGVIDVFVDYIEVEQLPNG